MTNDSSITLKAGRASHTEKTPSENSVNIIRQFARTYTYINKGSLSTVILN